MPRNRSLWIIAAAALGWILLKPWVHGASERFYLLLPPVALALLLTSRQPRKGRIIAHTALAAACLIAVGAYVTRPLWRFSKFSPTAADSLLPQAGIVAYFLLGVAIVLTVAWVLSQRLGRAVSKRLVRSDAPSRLASCSRAALGAAISLPLFIAFATPYVIAATYIHRFKIPNGTTPQRALKRPFEDVAFTTADGYRLRGWFMPAPKGPSARTVIICHGLNVNRAFFLGVCRIADGLNANTFMFDFRGHGDSDGRTVSLGGHEGLDVVAAVDYLRQHRPAQCKELIGLGISMGAAALIHGSSQLEKPLDFLILDSSFAAATDLADGVVAPFPAAIRPWIIAPGVLLASLEAGCWLSDVRPEDWIRSVRAPVFIIHGQFDEMIPLAHGKRIFEKALPPKDCWWSPIRGHTTEVVTDPQEYIKRVRQFMDKTCAVTRGPARQTGP
jgi:fermentation-respiration switch protein FrsA (DUF1100 family)